MGNLPQFLAHHFGQNNIERWMVKLNKVNKEILNNLKVLSLKSKNFLVCLFLRSFDIIFPNKKTVNYIYGTWFLLSVQYLTCITGLLYKLFMLIILSGITFEFWHYLYLFNSLKEQLTCQNLTLECKCCINDVCICKLNVNFIVIRMNQWME